MKEQKKLDKLAEDENTMSTGHRFFQKLFKLIQFDPRILVFHLDSRKKAEITGVE